MVYGWFNAGIIDLVPSDLVGGFYVDLNNFRWRVDLRVKINILLVVDLIV